MDLDQTLHYKGYPKGKVKEKIINIGKASKLSDFI